MTHNSPNITGMISLTVGHQHIFHRKFVQSLFFQTFGSSNCAKKNENLNLTKPLYSWLGFPFEA
jgi:hypothetical protein